MNPKDGPRLHWIAALLEILTMALQQKRPLECVVQLGQQSRTKLFATADGRPHRTNWQWKPWSLPDRLPLSKELRSVCCRRLVRIAMPQNDNALRRVREEIMLGLVI